MKPPTTKKEIQSLTERLAALNRFISRYSNRLQPFFKALKGTDTKGWGPEYDTTFGEIKEYVASRLSISQPIEGEELYLYLSSSAAAVRAALVRMDANRGQRPIHLVNKALSEVEARYLNFV